MEAFDPAAVLDRYDREREKRLAVALANVGDEPDLSGAFAGFDQDYYANPDHSREAIDEEVDALVIGAGLGGIMMAAKLRALGLGKLRVVEKGGGFGGTWYWNRYPGAACDIESYSYLPLLEATGYMPSERYARGEEIRRYLVELAGRFDLPAATLFQTQVTDLAWDESRRRWIATTDRGDRIAARFAVSCTGVLANPKLPKIPAIASFAGHSFHSSRWDYGYTGGTQDGGLTGLAGKRVGVIGTGCTAIQIVPAIAEWCGQLTLFQRTPSSIDFRGNGPTDPAWYAALEPGWQQARQDNFTSILSGGQEAIDLVADGWTDIAKGVSPPIGEVPSPEAAQLAGLLRMEQTRGRIEQTVRDQATAEALKPWYHYFCKRPAFHDEFLETFNRPNVTLVDTAGQGVERITPKGAVVAGKEYELDCIVYATGFDFLMEFQRESRFDIKGRDGLELSEHWGEGPRTRFGLHTDRFPNLFFLRLAQAGHGANYTQTVDEQTAYIAHAIGQCLEKRAETVEATSEVVDAWVAEVIEKAAPRQAFLETCTPGHYNYDANPARARFALLNELYGGGAVAYFAMLRQYRAEGRRDGLRFGFAGDASAGGAPGVEP